MPVRAFLSADVKTLLKNKFVVIIGGSVQRSVYKDLVQLLHTSKLVPPEHLKKKGELTFLDDKLIEGGSLGEMHNGITYKEEREYKTDFYIVRFYFVTRCYNDYVQSILEKLTREGEPTPDVIVMNSCVWDVTRYGPNAMQMYNKNLKRLFKRFDEVLSEDTQVIWTTQLPVDKKARGGFMVPEVDFLNISLQRDILEGNFYARQVAAEGGYDILDLYYFLKNMMHHQVDDGIHWNQIAHRRISNLILTHIAESWGCSLPARVLPFMDPRSHVYGIKHPDWSFPNGDSTYQDMAPDFQRRYGGPINRPNYMGPPRHHQRSVSVDPQYLEGPGHNGPPDFQGRYGGPINRPNYMGPQSRYGGPVNNPNFEGMPRNHNRSLSGEPQFCRRDFLQNNRFDQNFLQHAIEVLEEFQDYEWGGYQEDTFQVPAVPRRRVSYPSGGDNIPPNVLNGNPNQNGRMPGPMNQPNKRLRMSPPPMNQPNKKIRMSVPINRPNNMGPCRNHVRSVSMDPQCLERPGVLKPRTQNNMSWHQDPVTVPRKILGNYNEKACWENQQPTFQIPTISNFRRPLVRNVRQCSNYNFR